MGLCERMTTDGGKEPQRFTLDRKQSVWAKLSIKGADSKPATKQRPSYASRLKAGQSVVVYLDETKGKVIRIVIDKTAEAD